MWEVVEIGIFNLPWHSIVLVNGYHNIISQSSHMIPASMCNILFLNNSISFDDVYQILLWH